MATNYDAVPCAKCGKKCISRTPFCRDCAIKKCKTCKTKYQPYAGRNQCTKCYRATRVQARGIDLDFAGFAW